MVEKAERVGDMLAVGAALRVGVEGRERGGGVGIGRKLAHEIGVNRGIIEEGNDREGGEIGVKRGVGEIWRKRGVVEM